MCMSSQVWGPYSGFSPSLCRQRRFESKFGEVQGTWRSLTAFLCLLKVSQNYFQDREFESWLPIFKFTNKILFSGSWFTWNGSCFLTQSQSYVVHLKTQSVIWQVPFCICNEANAGSKSSIAFLFTNNHTLSQNEWYSRGDYKNQDREFLYLEVADVHFSLLLQLQFRAGTVVFTSWIF